MKVMLYFSLSLPFFDVWTPKCRMLRAKVFILKPRGRKRRQLQMKMKNYFGKRTVRLWTTSLLNSVYYLKGKIFGLRRSENRNLSLKNFELGPNFIKFEEDFCKTFHGGLCDLKYVPNSVKHICHDIGQKHDHRLLEVYRLYIGLVECKAKEIDSFCLRPGKQKLVFDKSPVLIYS